MAKIGSEYALNASIGGPDAARFSIQDGYLLLMQELDFEDQSQRISNLSVNFTSDSDSFVVCQVNVNTIDENDNDPRFSSSTTTFIVAQSALKTFVTNLKADDIDTTGTLSYSLPTGNTEFEIRNNNELWKLSALNKSSVAVTVSDSRNLDDTMTVTVEVEATVDEDLNLVFSDTIREEEPAGMMLNISVKDPQYEKLPVY